MSTSIFIRDTLTASLLSELVTSQAEYMVSEAVTTLTSWPTLRHQSSGWLPAQPLTLWLLAWILTGWLEACRLS